MNNPDSLIMRQYNFFVPFYTKCYEEHTCVTPALLQHVCIHLAPFTCITRSCHAFQFSNCFCSLVFSFRGRSYWSCSWKHKELNRKKNINKTEIRCVTSNLEIFIWKEVSLYNHNNNSYQRELSPILSTDHVLAVENMGQFVVGPDHSHHFRSHKPILKRDETF